MSGELYYIDIENITLWRMKSPKKDYEIRKSVVSEPGTGEDLRNFVPFYTLVIYHVIISRSNKCTSKAYVIN